MRSFYVVAQTQRVAIDSIRSEFEQHEDLDSAKEQRVEDSLVGTRLYRIIITAEVVDEVVAEEKVKADISRGGGLTI